MTVSERLVVDDLMAAQELFHGKGWTDGLPIVPPTADAVEACLSWAGLPADHLVGVEPVRQRALSAEKVAINAVMAGCLPSHFPVVVTAVTAMLGTDFLLHGASASMCPGTTSPPSLGPPSRPAMPPASRPPPRTPIACWTPSRPQPRT